MLTTDCAKNTHQLCLKGTAFSNPKLNEKNACLPTVESPNHWHNFRSGPCNHAHKLSHNHSRDGWGRDCAEEVYWFSILPIFPAAFHVSYIFFPFLLRSCSGFGDDNNNGNIKTLQNSLANFLCLMSGAMSFCVYVFVSMSAPPPSTCRPLALLQMVLLSFDFAVCVCVCVFDFSFRAVENVLPIPCGKQRLDD